MSRCIPGHALTTFCILGKPLNTGLARATQQNCQICSELETITGVAVNAFLRRLAKKEQLVRVRREQEYVYLTARSKRRRQKQARARFGSSGPLAHVEEDATTEELKKAIVILLEIIRSRPRTVRELKETLVKRHPEITGAMITEICRQYGVNKKKRSIHIDSSTTW